MAHVERALVAFARGSGAWVLYASGEHLQRAIDLFGRDADEIGLLRSREGWHTPMRGLYVWEGVPNMPDVFTALPRDAVPAFANGTWRVLTADEWALVQQGNILLWPAEAQEGFPKPRA